VINEVNVEDGDAGIVIVGSAENGEAVMSGETGEKDLEPGTRADNADFGLGFG
jgi:hypothetical protein